MFGERVTTAKSVNLEKWEFVDELIQAGRVKNEEEKKQGKCNTHSLCRRKKDHGSARKEIEEGFC